VTPLRGWRRGDKFAREESHVSRAITIRSDKKFGRDKFNAAENSDTPSGLEARETNSRGKSRMFRAQSPFVPIKNFGRDKFKMPRRIVTPLRGWRRGDKFAGSIDRG
jgi:hypothetical protein